MTSQNNYLCNILNPFHCPAVPIPDEHRQSTVVKTLLSTDTLNSSAKTDEIMLIMYPHSPRRQIRVYKKDPTGYWQYFGSILQEQDLAQNYDYLRPISAGMMVKSSTISGSKFNLNGIANAVITQASSDISSYSFKTLLAYGRSDMDKVAGVSISDGVAFCAYPGDYLYRTPITNIDTDFTTGFTKAFLDNSASSYRVKLPQQAMPGYVVPASSDWWGYHANIPSLDAGVEQLRLANMNKFGRVKLDAEFSFIAGAAGKFDLQLQLITTSGNYKNWLVEPNFKEYVSTAYSTATGQVLTFKFSDLLSLDTEIFGLRVSTAANPAGLTPFTNTNNGITLEYTEEYDIQTSATAFVMLMTGVDPDNQIVVDAVNSYELVPNAALSKNLPLLPKPETDQLQLEVAEDVANMAPSLGVPMVCSIKTFNETRKIHVPTVVKDHTSIQLSAASGNNNSKLWYHLKGLTRTAIPRLASLIGNLHPIAGMVGSFVSNLFDDLEPANDNLGAASAPAPRCKVSTAKLADLNSYQESLIPDMDRIPNYESSNDMTYDPITTNPLMWYNLPGGESYFFWIKDGKQYAIIAFPHLIADYWLFLSFSMVLHPLSLHMAVCGRLGYVMVHVDENGELLGRSNFTASVESNRETENDSDGSQSDDDLDTAGPTLGASSRSAKFKELEKKYQQEPQDEDQESDFSDDEVEEVAPSKEETKQKVQDASFGYPNKIFLNATNFNNISEKDDSGQRIKNLQRVAFKAFDPIAGVRVRIAMKQFSLTDLFTLMKPHNMSQAYKGTIFSFADFPYVSSKNGCAARILLSDKEVFYSYGIKTEVDGKEVIKAQAYHPTYINGIDSRLTMSKDNLEFLAAFRKTLRDRGYGEQMYITVAIGEGTNNFFPDVTVHESKINGNSYNFALYAALELMPSAPLYSGTLDVVETLIGIPEKLKLSDDQRRPLALQKQEGVINKGNAISKRVGGAVTSFQFMDKAVYPIKVFIVDYVNLADMTYAVIAAAGLTSFYLTTNFTSESMVVAKIAKEVKEEDDLEVRNGPDYTIAVKWFNEHRDALKKVKPEKLRKRLADNYEIWRVDEGTDNLVKAVRGNSVSFKKKNKAGKWVTSEKIIGKDKAPEANLKQMPARTAIAMYNSVKSIFDEADNKKKVNRHSNAIKERVKQSMEGKYEVDDL